jgi:hypothetical protein
MVGKAAGLRARSMPLLFPPLDLCFFFSSSTVCPYLTKMEECSGDNQATSCAAANSFFSPSALPSRANQSSIGFFPAPLVLPSREATACFPEIRGS